MPSLIVTVWVSVIEAEAVIVAVNLPVASIVVVPKFSVLSHVIVAVPGLNHLPVIVNVCSSTPEIIVDKSLFGPNIPVAAAVAYLS